MQQGGESVFEKPQTILNPSFLLILFISTLYYFNYNMTYPIIPLYAKSIGADKAIIGIISGIMMIAALLTRPFSGYAADRYDRKKQLLLALAIFSFSAFGYAFSQNIYLLILFRIFHGIGLCICSTILLTIACCFIPEDRISSGIGIYSLSQVVSMAAAPYLGLVLAEHFGYVVCFLTSGFLTVIAFSAHSSSILPPRWLW
jgi:MFS family permease